MDKLNADHWDGFIANIEKYRNNRNPMVIYKKQVDEKLMELYGTTNVGEIIKLRTHG